jgi:hypothetical protein
VIHHKPEIIEAKLSLSAAANVGGVAAVTSLHEVSPGGFFLLLTPGDQKKTW